MSEYIITDKQMGLIQDFANVCVEGEKLPRIVRCRDCQYYGCYDGSMWCSRTYEQVPGGTCDYQTVEPDGFCAWAKRREQ